MAVLSKVPFYVAGSVLAAWAVLVSFLGLRRPDFPGTRGRARAVMGVSAGLVAVAVGLAIATSTRETGKEAPAQAHASAKTTLALAADPGGALAFDKKSLTAGAGAVTIDFTNRSSTQHNVTIEQGSKTVAASSTIANSTAMVTAKLAPGTYTFYCSVDAHRQGGMQGTLTVK